MMNTAFRVSLGAAIVCVLLIGVKKMVIGQERKRADSGSGAR